ncbi:MAG TPA: nucleotide exchange factor GrpE [Pyrinomonadaceae bacterium]|nr:nucleotide exchange factor GrpE [Pyrinomonadaceae bacterium]
MFLGDQQEDKRMEQAIMKRYLSIVVLLALTILVSAVRPKARGGTGLEPHPSASPTPKINGGRTANGESTASKPSPTVRVKTSPSPTPKALYSETPFDRSAVTPPGGLGLVEPTPTPTPPLTADDLGFVRWLTNPLLFSLVVFLLILALGLHLLHLLRVGALNRNLEHLFKAQQSLASSRLAAGSAGKDAVGEKLVEQFNQQAQRLNELTDRFKQVENHLTANDSQVGDAVQAVGLTANWIGQTQLREAFAANGGSISDSERAATVTMLDGYREPLRLNASRVEPVALAVAELVDNLEGRAYSSPELVARVRNLYDEIGRFDQWHKDASDQLASLRRGSFAQRSATLKADQERLFEEVKNGSISVGQMVQQSRSLIEKHFPESPERSAEENFSLAERESSLKKVLSDAPDYLMDWYNDLFQLQTQLEQGQRSPIEAETATELSKIQNAAREALGRFDIQPEAIQVGQTSFDRRLHDATLVRQSAQFPINTVIEVHKCGFRRMSTGEALRRPQVVVAGSAAG